MLKQFIDFVTEKFTEVGKNFEEVESKISANEESIKSFESFDPSPLMEKIEEVKTLIPEVPEPTPVYDDSEVKNMIEEVKKSIPEAPEAFDPSPLEEQIKSIPTYDDKEIHAKLEELQKHINAEREIHQKEITEIKKELEAPLKVEVPVAKHFAGTPEKKGAMILHENNLYVNLLDDNDSEPSKVNKSYKLLIEAPKSFEHVGVYDASKSYDLNQTVMWKNSSWVKTKTGDGEPGASDSWKLMAKAVRGKKGEATVYELDHSEKLDAMNDEILFLKEEIKNLKAKK